jgi:hypothetical protein
MMTNFFRYGWPRRYLLRLVDRLPERQGDRLLDFLYPTVGGGERQ